jgi:hypothetical protein
MKWVDEITNRERIEEIFFREEIFLIRWSDHLIWSTEFYFITHHSILHAWTIRSRTASAYLRRFVSSIFHQLVDFASSRSTIIQSRWFIQVEMIFFISTDFRNRREINEHEDEYTILMKSDRSDNEARRWLDSKEKTSRDERRSRSSERSRWIKKWDISK